MSLGLTWRHNTPRLPTTVHHTTCCGGRHGSPSVGTALGIEASVCDTFTLSSYLAPLSLFKPNSTAEKDWLFFVGFNEGVRVLGMRIDKTAISDSVHTSTIRNGQTFHWVFNRIFTLKSCQITLFIYQLRTHLGCCSFISTFVFEQLSDLLADRFGIQMLLDTVGAPLHWGSCGQNQESKPYSIKQRTARSGSRRWFLLKLSSPFVLSQMQQVSSTFWWPTQLRQLAYPGPLRPVALL